MYRYQYSGGGLAALLLTLIFTGQLLAQDPARFESEVREISARNRALWDPYRPTIVFTGSSSIRMWDSLQDDFPAVQALNTGFGGSEASDLLFYLDTLVLQFNPSRVAIYEGDNDLAEGKSAGRAFRDLRKVIEAIRLKYPGMPIILIAAKPSIARWNLRGKYERFNRKLSKLAAGHALLSYADVWTPMLQGDALNESLYIEDGLHMNPEGYRIWKQVLSPLIVLQPGYKPKTPSNDQ